MSAPAVTIYATGMVCGVGLNTPSACAAIRAGINNFQETRFMDNGGEWIMGCEVPLEQAWRGRAKLVKMAAMAIRDCLTDPEGNIQSEETPLLLCVAEAERPGRLAGLDDALFREIQDELGMAFHDHSSLIPQGRVAGAVALYQARKLIHEQGCKRVLIVGVDSLLSGTTLIAYQKRERLFTSLNSNGFMPGEAAAALLVGAPQTGDPVTRLHCIGMGFAVEKATVESEIPLRAEGLSSAIKAATAELGAPLAITDFRIADLSGEHYYFKEAALALSRCLRDTDKFHDLWHPADCVGECGAAMGLLMTAVLRSACLNGYAPGRYSLHHTGADNGKRAALIFGFDKASH